MLVTFSPQNVAMESNAKCKSMPFNARKHRVWTLRAIDWIGPREEDRINIDDFIDRVAELMWARIFSGCWPPSPACCEASRASTVCCTPWATAANDRGHATARATPKRLMSSSRLGRSESTRSPRSTRSNGCGSTSRASRGSSSREPTATCWRRRTRGPRPYVRPSTGIST